MPTMLLAPFLAFALALFLIAAINPEEFIRFLGRGRVKPSPAAFRVFRVLAALCVLGTFYRLVLLLRH